MVTKRTFAALSALLLAGALAGPATAQDNTATPPGSTTTAQETPMPDATSPSMSSDEPMATINLVPLKEQLAAEFPLPVEEMVDTIEVPMSVAATLCGVEESTLTPAAEGDVGCEVAEIEPLVEFLATLQDAESDEIPDPLKKPADDMAAGAAGSEVVPSPQDETVSQPTTAPN